MQRLLTILLTTVSLALGMALPLRAAMAVEVPAATPVMAQLLFVQNAQGVEVAADGRTLTLKGLSPTTLFFSDRPVRIAGHYLTGEYLQFWKAGPDSFLKDPPNATLSVFEKGKDELSDVVVTLRNPRLNGNDLSYDITVISGTLPKTSGPASLFIDIIGLPFTPLSFAGVARRTAYRTVVWGSAATAAAATHPVAPRGLRRASAGCGTGTGSEPGTGRCGGQAEGAEVAADAGSDHRGGLSGGITEAAQPDRAVAHAHARTNRCRRRTR